MIVGSPIILNLVPGGVMKCVHVNEVNKNIEIQFKVMNGAAPYNVPEGVTCTIRGTKGDAFGYAAEAAVTVGSNVVTVTLTEQMTAVAGAGNIFELVFVGAADDMKVSTENFILAVERQAMGEDTVISDSDLSYAEQVLDQLQDVGAVNAQVQQNKANLAAEISRAQAAEAAETAARQAADNTLQSNINAEASTRATQDASLQAQIDQLIAPEGEAPSAAEVENARVGADGTTYPTLGDAIRTQVTDVKSAIDNLNSYFDVGFNLYNGIYHAESAWKTATCEMTASAGHWCTDLIPVDPSKGLRVRVGASAKPYKLLAYDSNLTPYIGSTSALWAIDITDRIYVSVTFDNSVDPSTVMVAYTNETTGASSDKWDELFPGIGYVPYYHVLDEEKVHVESCEELKAELDEIKNDGVYDTNDFLSDVAVVTGVSVTTDADGLPMAYFLGSGSASTKNWMTVLKNCQEYQVAVVEFTGKSSHPEYDPSVGAMLIIEFLDKNNAVIGSKYNGFVLGTTRCGFHRYGAVAPKGTVKASLRFVTRALTDMWIKSVAFRILNVYPMQGGNRVHGHLGMTYSAPRNTMVGFEMSKSAGFNTVVTNVKATQDGVLVALHDNTIDATSDGTGNVSDYTYAQLLQYDFGSWFSTYYTGTKIPTIDSVMKFFCVSGIRPGLSLHSEFTDDTNISTLCGILKKYGFGKRCLVKSFSLAILDKMHAILGDGEELEYFLDKSTVSTDLIDTIVSSYSYLTGVEIASTGVNSTIVEYAKAHGLEVSSYYGDDIAQNKEFMGMGVTRFCTDTFSDVVFPTD